PMEIGTVRWVWLTAWLIAPAVCCAAADQSPAPATAPGASAAAQWRAEHRIIDMHEHIDFIPEHLARAVKIMDAVGIGVAVNLGTGTVMPGKDGAPSEFERNKKLADTLH